MKAVLLRGPNDVLFDEIPVPKITDDEVLVEVKYCGICGSDVHAIPEAILYPPGTYLGHEFSGVITEVGKNVKGWQAGDRVVANPMYSCGRCEACLRGRHSICDDGFKYAIAAQPGLEFAGAFAKYIKVSVPERRLYALPDGVDFEEGALVEPLAVCLHAVRMSSLKPVENIVVLGAGCIGLGVIANARHAGAGKIIATEILPRRTAAAKKLGADYVLNPKTEDIKERVLEITGGCGVDIVFDCSGAVPAFQSAPAYLKRGGEIILTGIITKEVPILPMDWSINEWRLQGTMCYYAEEFPMTINFLENKVAPVKEIISSVIKLDDIIEKGFKTLSNPDNDEIKILVEP